LISESQKLYDQNIEYKYIPPLTSPNSSWAEVMRGQYSLPHRADAIIEDSDVLVKICAGLLARYRNCLLPELSCSGQTDYSQGSL
jgi:hypothetical protein